MSGHELMSKPVSDILLNSPYWMIKPSNPRPIDINTATGTPPTSHPIIIDTVILEFADL